MDRQQFVEKSVDFTQTVRHYSKINRSYFEKTVVPCAKKHFQVYGLQELEVGSSTLFYEMRHVRLQEKNEL